MFQKSVRYDVGSGMPGEFAYTGPRRAEPGILIAAGAVGCIFSEDPARPNFWQPGLLSGSVRHALLTTPKQYTSFGTVDGGPLAATLVLPANFEGEFTSMGQVWVQCANADALPGDLVYFDNTTGEITSAAKGARAPSGFTLLPGAVIAPRRGGDREDPVAAGLVVVTLNGPLPPSA